MKKIILSALVLAALALTSCSYIDILSSSSNAPISSSSSQEPSTSKKPSALVSSTYENYVKNSVFYESAIPTSTPKSKYLVLPVWFEDSLDLIRTGETKDSIHEKITTAFSGTKEETGWNSVKTFYATESGGKKEFDVTVADWYDCGYESRYIAGDQNDADIGSNTDNIILKTINAYFRDNPTEKRQDYDSDGDGYLDAVAIIYAVQDYKSDFDFARYYHKGPSASFTNFWAFVYWFQDPSHQNVNYPGPNAYLWASYDFANVSSKQDPGYPVTVDAHAYIHETGHLFGLDDYYDYTGNNKPAGGFSMQDYNVGMHDPYSVISLGWGDIKVPDKSETITIEPFTTSHQVILLSNNYQDSIFDEYLLLELYTPDGLNELDSTYSFEGSYPQGPSTPGIRLWHVDARLAYKLGRGYDYEYSEDQITNQIDTQYYYNMLCRNNTYSRGKEADYFSPLAGRKNYANYRLLDLIRNKDYLKMREKENLSSDDLFIAGDSFDMSTYSRCFVERGRMNTGKDLGWSFTIDALSSESATITFTKL